MDSTVAQRVARNTSKFLLLYLEERSGEYEYTHRSVHILPNNLDKTAEHFTKDYARKFYGSKPEPGDGGYYFNGGELFVRIRAWQFISKRDFDSLSKYIH